MLKRMIWQVLLLSRLVFRCTQELHAVNTRIVNAQAAIFPEKQVVACTCTKHCFLSLVFPSPCWCTKKPGFQWTVRTESALLIIILHRQSHLLVIWLAHWPVCPECTTKCVFATTYCSHSTHFGRIILETWTCRTVHYEYKTILKAFALVRIASKLMCLTHYLAFSLATLTCTTRLQIKCLSAAFSKIVC